MSSCLNCVLFSFTLSIVFRFSFSFNQFSFVRPPPDDLYKVGDVELGFQFSEEEMLKLKIWPGGVIPYFIDDFSFDKGLRDKIRSTVEKMNQYTGLQFVELPVPPEDDSTRWVLFLNRRGQLPCMDYTTKSFTFNGVQNVVLGYDCLGAGGSALAATVLALAGVPPQHNAPDRDDYIEVLTDNILRDKRHLFEAIRSTDWLFHDIAYDFNSAGHYDFYKYTINGSATIRAKQKLYTFVGEAEFLSYKDILKIKLLYNYITKKKQSMKSSDCSKIFKPGKTFSTLNFVKPEDLHVASMKPDEYLYENHQSLKHSKKRTTPKLDSHEIEAYFPLKELQ